MNFQFIRPEYLCLLFIIPLFVIIYFASAYFNKKKAITFPNFEAMRRVFGVEIFSRNFFSLYLNIFIAAALIFSLAGTVLVYSGTGAVIIAIDGSESMNTADVLPTRFEAAKSSAKGFINALNDDVSIGVVEFAGKTEVLQKPDSIKAEARAVIDRMVLDGAGTDFQEVIYSTNFLLEDYDKKYLVVFSDGQINVGDLNRTAKYAKDNGIVINAVAVGTETGGLTEVGTVSKLDEYSLQRLSFATGGQYSRVDDLSSIDNFFSEVLIDYEEDISFDISSYLLFAAIILFVLVWIIHNFRFRTLP